MNTNMIRVRIGKRHWEILLLSAESDPQQVEQLLMESPHRPDMVLIQGNVADQQSLWKEVARNCFGQDADAVFLTNPAVAQVGMQPMVEALVIGRKRFIERFSSEIAPDSSTTTSNQSPFVASALDPAGCVPFLEAEYLDPFAINPIWRRQAWDKAWTLIGRLARELHQKGIALTWPTLSMWGYSDPDFKPWRSVASLSESIPTLTCPLDPDQQIEPFSEQESGDMLLRYNLHWFYSTDTEAQESGQSIGESKAGPVRGQELSLKLLQRILLGLHTAEVSTPISEICWPDVAELLEELGYLAVSCSYVLGIPDQLRKFFDGGFLLANVHKGGNGYGDMHTGNYGYISRGLPLIFDSGGTYKLKRPDSPIEKASDLAVFRLECDFLRWEAVRLGYWAVSPDVAESVFARFPEELLRQEETTS